MSKRRPRGSKAEAAEVAAMPVDATVTSAPAKPEAGGTVQPVPEPAPEPEPTGALGPETEPNVEPAPEPEPEPAPAAEPNVEPEARAPVPPSHRFLVWRGLPVDARGRFDVLEWTPAPDATVMDAMLELRRRDPSLVLRQSCMHGSCGACGVRVNGREALACDTRVADLRTLTVKVEPLRGQHLIADLATDMTDFIGRLEAAGLPLVRSAETRANAVPPEGVRAYTRFENCIECGLCLSACPVERADSSFIGPAALAAAQRVVEEPRGRSLDLVLALAADPNSVWRCTDAMECTAVCPAAVEPARSLFELRRGIVVSRLKALFRRRRKAAPAVVEGGLAASRSDDEFEDEFEDEDWDVE